jgi:two-component system, NtrC family, nitrogen regulation sensor histidine kinase NtrY
MHAISNPDRPRRRLPFELKIQLFALIGGFPAVISCFLLLWLGNVAPLVRWTVSILVIAIWVGCGVAIRSRVSFPLRTIGNLVGAIREGDYSLRSRESYPVDALGEVMREVNALGETLLARRRDESAAAALLHGVMAEIEVAVFAFDDGNRLRLANRAGSTLLGLSETECLNRSARELDLADCLSGDHSRTLARTFPGGAGTRWSLRRSGFREGGKPHQLLILADVSRPLRDEERMAWQRLIRVLGHELNNSLAPIQSIANSLGDLISSQNLEERPGWGKEIESGLEIIAGRAEALGRFMEAYGRLARLPLPNPRDQSLSTLVFRAAALETRCPIEVCPGTEIHLRVDGDQIEQILINLIRNAADAALQTHGAVQVRWMLEERFAEICVEDGGLGLSSRQNLFVPFFTTKPDGSGIGLVISRQIAEAHGGTLDLENRPDGQPGCRAVLRLPISGENVFRPRGTA